MGAGESAVEPLVFLKNNPEVRNCIYIIAVDAVLKTFKALNLKADAAVCEECQSIIARAFSGCAGTASDNTNSASGDTSPASLCVKPEALYDTLFLSITGNTSVSFKNRGRTIFYAPLYTNAGFLKKLCSEGILQNIYEPLGSVGLSAVNLALKIRQNDEVPVYVCGLDFSYSKNRTHAASSFHDRERSKKINRLSTLEKLEAAFSPYAEKLPAKELFTTKNLSGYAELFADRFSGVKNIFNLGKAGIDLKIPKRMIEELTDSTKYAAIQQENAIAQRSEEPAAREVTEKASDNTSKTVTAQKSDNRAISEQISAYIQKEKDELRELRDILSGKIPLSEEERNSKIQKLLENREYLYLHFPDGTRASTEISFLKRVRSQIDFFLKLIEIGEK